jgi:hypothetical protein
MSDGDNGQPAENKIELPVTHDKCPVCGETKRLGQITIDNLKKDKSISDNFPYAGIVLQAQIIDPMMLTKILTPTINVKTIQVGIDVCANPDCGAVYCVRFEVIEQPVQVTRQQMPMPRRHN